MLLTHPLRLGIVDVSVIWGSTCRNVFKNLNILKCSYTMLENISIHKKNGPEEIFIKKYQHIYLGNQTMSHLQTSCLLFFVYQYFKREIC